METTETRHTAEGRDANINKTEPKKQNSGEINFRPLTEGLGFQPFSDGLPYAPLQKTPTSAGSLPARAPAMPNPMMGTGAVAAGPARLAKTLPAGGPSQQARVHRTEEVAATPRSADEPQDAQQESQPGLLYVFQRVMAYTLDVFIVGIIFLAAVSAMVNYRLIGSEVLMNEEALLLGGLSFLILNWFLITFQEVFLGSSIGKRLFRLGLPGGALRILWRAILFVPFSLLGVGLIWGLFSSRKSCLHDQLSGIQPIDL